MDCHTHILTISTLDFLRLWIDNFYQRDFTTDFNSATLYKFLSEIQDAGIHDATQLKLLIMRRAGQKLHSQFFVEASQGKKKAKLKKTPTTLVSPQNTQISFDSISANDFAACLCLSDWELFSDIPESEWTNKVWTYDKECIYSISKMVKRFNNACITFLYMVLTLVIVLDRRSHCKRARCERASQYTQEDDCHS